ncbi:protein FAM160B2-like isoform X2 [Polyodon spathula]|uniref:protein FAM160B2-like isoform X2 n=1 Tax=Polyodon spathula TaxID=7913 RepID=UPI001B7F16C9|nr:protein FAM160B2-like isoform X2 [Polyodon spathula]
MLDILIYEEQHQEETGPCMEYLLQHKLLETLGTLGKAQYPPGMNQQVLIFFTKLLGQIQQPMLHIINVYRPTQKLIRQCGILPGSQLEKEEVQFLYVICNKLKQDPYLLNYILEAKSEVSKQRHNSTSGDEEGRHSAAKPSTAASSSLSLLSDCTALGSRAAGHAGPSSGTQERPASSSLAHKADTNLVQALINLSKSQKSKIALKSSEALLLLVGIPKQETASYLTESTALCQLVTDRLCELYSQVPTSIDPADVETVERVSWRGQFSKRCAEDPAVYPGREHLEAFLLWVDYCDHLLKEAHRISVATLRLFEQLLQKPHEHIIFNLVLRNLELRSYIAASSACGLEDRHAVAHEQLDDTEELEEDPFFTDMYPESGFQGSEQLLSLPPRETAVRPAGNTGVNDIVNSFLCLVPQEAKTSQNVLESGYDTYVRDAHTLFQDCTSYSREWGWPQEVSPLESSTPASDFYEGHFLKVLFDRLARILDQPYELNLQITSVVSKLAVFSHPHLHEYLLDPYINLAPGSRSLFSVLVRVIGDLMQRIQHIPNFTGKLLLVREQLIGLEPEAMTDHLTLLKGVTVLEEFCKELAAIAFVKYPVEEQ